VDWALAADALPPTDEAGKFMGTWTAMGTLPQILGLFSGAVILQLLRGIPNHFGYTALFLLTIVYFALGTLLRAKSRSLALAATLLSAAGMLLFGIAYFIPAQALGALGLVGHLAPGAAEPAYQGAFWYDFSVSLLVPALYVWGAGQVLFGWLAWRSRVLPGWLAVIGLISGIASFAPPFRFVQAIVLDSFVLWSFTTGIVLLRSRRQ